MPNDNLFDSDTLYSATPLGAKASAPVRCLGKDFKNDEERRAFFRDELRKQLPDLRKLEGFPIGEDDDIIALSDPPYYTACPNPWLNDFIAEWEEDKKALVAKKKRKEGHEVHEPYASDVSEGKNNPIYNAHSYHTKVPHPAIMRYILHYTQPGDIIYDGFAGTGMTGVAAQFCESPDSGLKETIELEFDEHGQKKPIWGARKAICGDLSPIASFIASNYNTPIRIDQFEAEAGRILKEVEKECGWMYETYHTDGAIGRINYTVWSDVFICPDCSDEIVFWEAAVNKKTGEVYDSFACPHCDKKQTKRGLARAFVTIYDRAISASVRMAKTVPVLINYSIGKKRYDKGLDSKDLALIKKIEMAEIPYWFPINRMLEGAEGRRNDGSGLTHVHHFYTKRNLWILAAFYGRCTQPALKLMFNSQLINLSKMNRYRPNVSFPYNPLSGTLYIGSQVSEANVFDAYRNKAGKLAIAFSNIQKPQVVQVASATKVELRNSTVDYIFTDPPFGANISYSELSYIWESWYKETTNTRLEAIENNSVGKNLFDYQRLMERCFSVTVS